jgi:hypothetical protein
LLNFVHSLLTTMFCVGSDCVCNWVPDVRGLFKLGPLRDCCGLLLDPGWRVGWSLNIKYKMWVVCELYGVAIQYTCRKFGT